MTETTTLTRDDITLLHDCAEELLQDNRFKAHASLMQKAVKLIEDGRITQGMEGLWNIQGSEGDHYTFTRDGCTCKNAQKNKTSKYGCHHAVATVLLQSFASRRQPSMFPAPRTAEERLAETPPQTAQDAPGGTQAPEPDPSDPETLLDDSDAKHEGVMPDTYIPEPASVPVVPQEMRIAEAHLMHSGAVMHEAPYSATASVESPGGFEWLLTVRKQEHGEFQKAIKGLEAWCLKEGYTPRARHQSGHQPAPQAEGTAPPPEAHVCNYHGPMKESEKARGTWYCPKKLADGSYCKERWPKAA